MEIARESGVIPAGIATLLYYHIIILVPFCLKKNHRKPNSNLIRKLNIERRTRVLQLLGGDG